MCCDFDFNTFVKINNLLSSQVQIYDNRKNVVLEVCAFIQNII